jgi:hypothetical protein
VPTARGTLWARFADLKLQIDGLVPPDKLFHRRVLFDGLYASLPKEPEAKVQIYTAEIVPKGWTNFHCHNGATFFIALQGIFESKPISGTASLFAPKPATSIQSRSARCIAATTRTTQFLICTWRFVSPRRTATT